MRTYGSMLSMARLCKLGSHMPQGMICGLINASFLRCRPEERTSTCRCSRLPLECFTTIVCMCLCLLVGWHAMGHGICRLSSECQAFTDSRKFTLKSFQRRGLRLLGDILACKTVCGEGIGNRQWCGWALGLSIRERELDIAECFEYGRRTG
jgi:hypothetical protein